ncbi:MAG: hypothetical protein HY901_18220 [Deltaproteobacteria bacterium]|nr:hypothetical protein [Deltaproteobacteria bacterium]
MPAWPQAHRRVPAVTTQFDHLLKDAFTAIFPGGSSTGTFYAPRGRGFYEKGVQPDFVMPDGRWVDFKLHVSYREKTDVAWKPSALYTSLRKYIDHPDNKPGGLVIVYRHRHGAIADVVFPITRGRKALVRDAADFGRLINLVDVRVVYPKMKAAGLERMIEAIERL